MRNLAVADGPIFPVGNHRSVNLKFWSMGYLRKSLHQSRGAIQRDARICDLEYFATGCFQRMRSALCTWPLLSNLRRQYCSLVDWMFPPFKYHYSRLNLPCSQTESPAMNISIYYIEDHWSHRRVLAFRISLEVLANWLAESARSFQLLLVTRWKEMFAVEAEGEDSDIYYQKKHISKQF